VGNWFESGSGVKQGCAIAPLLLNVFFDCMVRQAIAALPAGCGVQLAYTSNEVFEKPPASGAAVSMQMLSVLLYADDMVLISCVRAELECMLRVVDDICSKMGMCINTSKI
jgi:hypothetical protein